MVRYLRRVFSKDKGQLELEVPRPFEHDRNYAKGGRSFYFFDFDDNVAVVPTPAVLFHKKTGAELHISSREFARSGHEIGKTGLYADYLVEFNDRTGTFRFFRDQKHTWLEKILGRRQIFIEDMAKALKAPDWNWKGPSWQTFYHATYNRRPISIITARGHHPDTIRKGFHLFKEEGFIPHEPNYLDIFPVSHPDTRRRLQDFEMKLSVAELKKKAIIASVDRAIERYGYSDHHRFGMSDDDPRNIELIVEAMTELKSKFPKISFFVIEAHDENVVKKEIFADHIENKTFASVEQLSLFEESR